ncbi:MAG: amino acid adenylation domain-containing protein [Thermoanaerobaculia bacterium]
MSGAEARPGETYARRVWPARPLPVFAASEIEQSVGRRFEGVVRAHPDRVAVRASGQHWTYTRLNATANRIARGLQTFPDPGRPVALWLRAGPTLFAAMLATLKAGRFYVPLDPALGPERLRAILGEADAAVILTDRNGVADAARLSGDGALIVRVEGIADDGPPDDLGVAVSPDDLAYVLFTSGSTGRPKGVMQSHRNLLHNILKLSNGLGIVPDDRLTLLSSCSYGASVSDIYGALLNGAAVCPYPLSEDGLLRLRLFLAEEGITILHCVPSLFRQLAVSLDGSEDLSRLRLIKLGGEPVLSSDFGLYRERFPRRCLFHVGLGSAEMHVIRQWFADHDSMCPTSIAPLGYAVDGTEVLLLDSAGRPTSADTGEIAVVSRTLPLGYWKRPDLTAEAFVPAPGREGERMFRSGDLGRLLPDGCLLYVGRRDSRMKIRGHWVELSEIEAALNMLPGVREAAVAAREGPGGTRLIAYLVAPTPDRLGAAAMRQALSGHLSAWMVPTLFLFVDALPRTATGKIDRNALPVPDASRPELGGIFVAPRNAVEAKIARIFCEVLGLERVGIHDNFFDFGGHSLLAAQLAAQIEKQLGRQVAFATIFRAPTVAELAEIFRGRRRSKRPLPSLVAIQSKGTRPPFFCVHAIAGIVYYRELALALGPDQPFYGLQSQGLDRERRPYETVEEMAAHYVREVREVQPEGPYYLGGYSFGGKVAFEMARQLRSQGQKTTFLAIFDAANRLPVAPRPTRLEFVLHRTRIHLETLKEIRAWEKLSYLLRRAGTVLLLMGGALERGYEALFHPLRRAQREVLEANGRAARRYVPTFYDGRVTLFRARDRSKDSPQQLSLTPHLGWDELCGEGVEVHEVPGGHSSLMEERANIWALGEKLAECLHRTQDTEPSERDGLGHKTSAAVSAEEA